MNFTERFLKAKHWQLFILLFGIPILFQFALMTYVVVSIINAQDQDPFIMFRYFKVFPVMMIIFMAGFFGWIWSIAIGLQKNIPVNVKIKTGTFKVFFFIPLVYITLVALLSGMVFTRMSTIVENYEGPDPMTMITFVAFIMPIHLFSIICLLYCLYFAAKVVKTAELQRETSFSDFVGEFFLLWFYPVGVWFIQPKVNQMVKAKSLN